MIRHIVLFSFGQIEADARGEAFNVLRRALVPLEERIPHVASLRVDRNAHAAPPLWDAALVSEHASWHALAEYQVHPAHLAALDVVNSVIESKAIVDYEL